MTRAGGLPDFAIRVNGAPLPLAAWHDVRVVTVEESLDEAAWFTVELSNWDEEQLRVTWSDAPLFAVGADVEISLGHVGELRVVLHGEVTSLAPAFSAGRPPVVTVGGYDHGHRLTRLRRSRSYVKMKDSAIAQQIAGAAGLRAAVTDTRAVLDYVAQANQTDWAFLRGRAARIGYALFVRDKVLHFGPPDLDGRAAATLGVGREITEFRPRLSAVGQVGEVTVRGWAVKDKREVVGQARSGVPPMGAPRPGSKTADAAFGRSGTVLVDLVPGTKAEADRIALGAWNGAGLGFVRGTVECGGQPGLRAGAVVEITGAGTRFSGRYRLVTVAHSLDADGYRTRLTVERNAA